MADLAGFVADLVRQASTETDPRHLRVAVERVLDGFDSARAPEREDAVRTIGRALQKVEGRGAQVLCLALGALVEAGASPEVAWTAISRDLKTLLEQATAFATAAVRHSKMEHVESAVEASGAEVAKKKPREGAAWKALPARALAAVACLVRSKPLRAKERKRSELLAAAWPLSDVVSEVGDLLQALRIVDDETLLVLAPHLGRGYAIAIDQMPSNAELYILLGAALLGDAKKGRIPGKTPDPRAIAAIKTGAQTKKMMSVTLPFQLHTWNALGADGALPPADAGDAEHAIWIEGIVADIPRLGTERVVFLQQATPPLKVPVVPPFEGLRPDLRVIRELSSADVLRAMIQITNAIAKPAKPAPKTKAKPAPKTKAKPAPKTKAKPAPKTKAKAR